MKTNNGAQISWLLIFLWILSVTDPGSCKKILIFCPSPVYSHQQVYKSLIRALLKHNHEVVHVTSLPLNDRTIRNYTEIDVTVAFSYVNKWNTYKLSIETDWAEFKQVVYRTTNAIVDYVFGLPEIQKLYTNGRGDKFDLVIFEQCIGPAASVFAYRLNVPLIGLSTMDLHIADRHTFGSPMIPSHPSNWEKGLRTGMDLSFWERTMSFINACLYIYRFRTDFIQEQRQIVEKNFGHTTPDIVQIQRNMSLMLLEHDPILTYPVPDHPHFIKFSSIHILDEPPKLPTELKDFLDGATKGFIYMSLGSSMRTEHIPKTKIQTFINVFSKLPYKVLWKFESDDINVNGTNIYTLKWAPQQSILAHPNIRLFIYQGGLQSTDEAVHNAVPLIGIPCAHDQYYQVNKMVSLGVAQQLDLATISEKSLYDAISEVTRDKRYKERMLKIRNILQDKPYDSLENMVWWIEYVMRHNGAPFLKYSGINDPWYKRYDMDIITFLANVLLLSAMLIAYISYIAISWFCRYSSASRHPTKLKSL